MKIARVRHGGGVHLARIEAETATLLREEDPGPTGDVVRASLADAQDWTASGTEVELDAVTLLAPVRNPSKVIGVGLNYADHARESGVEAPAAPLLFAKAPSSVTGPGDAIGWSTEHSTQVDYEAELAVVIGRVTGPHVSDPLSHVLGYTCCNDVSARDAQFGDGQWTRGKSFDSFCPLGPWIVTADEIPDPQQLRLGCDVDGERLQDGTTADMIFSVADIIEYTARFMRLLPGDVIATGTPAGVGLGRTPPRYLEHGDTVTIWVEGIGSITNPCGPASGR